MFLVKVKKYLSTDNILPVRLSLSLSVSYILFEYIAFYRCKAFRCNLRLELKGISIWRRSQKPRAFALICTRMIMAATFTKWPFRNRCARKGQFLRVIFICPRHLIRSRTVTNRILFLRKSFIPLCVRIIWT